MSEITKDDLLRMAEDHARRVMVGGAEQITPLCHAIRSTGEQIVFCYAYGATMAKSKWRSRRARSCARARSSAMR